jgi:hypothetical protein
MTWQAPLLSLALQSFAVGDTSDLVVLHEIVKFSEHRPRLRLDDRSLYFFTGESTDRFTRSP